MNTMKDIRTDVFRVNQAEMAVIAGANQSTVSRWEKGELTPTHNHLRRIREEAVRRKLRWNDAWLFEAA